MILDQFEELRRMHKEMDRLYERLSETGKVPLLKASGKKLVPADRVRLPVSGISETESKVIVQIELPGVPKENIELNVGEDSIEVKALNKTEKEVKQKGAYSYEARSAQFYRKFPLPAEVKPEQAAAVFKDGLLRVEIPKAKQIEHKKGKRIDIK
ncbi:MAG: Hsp20/alpha crystallin family protein [Nanoarchaeota archaeon]